jgi:hypothetical protein
MEERLDETYETQGARLFAIDHSTLTPLVQSALGSGTVEVTHWEREQLHGGFGSGTAVYRYVGEGRDQGRMVPWSLILKVLHPSGGSADISAWNCYRREAAAFQSGCLDNLPGGLAAPRCFGVVEHADGTCWIWLEELTDDIGPHWPFEHYGVVARHAGQFNGAYLSGRPCPSWPWLSSGWLREFIGLNASTIPQIRRSLDHPMVRRSLPREGSERFFRLWEERNLYLDALDRLPQTLCHMDLFRRNLFARKRAGSDGYETVAVDWAYAGWGAIGTELVPLVQASVTFFEVDLSQVQVLEDVVFAGYLEGLRDAGWQSDPRQVRLGYTAASLRYRFADLWRTLPILLDESLHAIAEQVLGRTQGEVCDHFAEVGSLMYRLTDEARGLMDVLG